ncbi:MAG: ECF transporter S component [Oscillospiraceae bacterium]|nr:ECF transporter S component [Oscillospiraceae bacterium]
MNTSSKTTKLVILGLLTAILLVMAYTPLGYLNIGPLAISFNMIPVAIAAITLGPVGGAVVGAVFGLTSFLQCIGVGGTSGMGVILFEISPVLAFVQRFVPRVLDGFLLGYIYSGTKKLFNPYAACFVTGFFSAFLNTAFFMTALVALFGNTDYVRELMDGRNVIVFICAFVGVNAVCEMLSSTVISGAVGTALIKAKLIPTADLKKASPQETA